MGASVPIIDLESFRRGDDPDGATAQAMAEACAQIGFLVVSGHGVDAEVIDDAQREARAFFHLPLDVKRRCQPPVSWYFRGYEPPGGSALAKSLGAETPPDLCELFRISRFDDPGNVAAAGGGPPELEYFYGANIWPDEPAGLRPALERYYAELETLAMTIMRLFAIGLQLPEEWFADKFDRHITNLCVNYYPPQHEPPAPGQLRRGATLRLRQPDGAAPGRCTRRARGAHQGRRVGVGAAHLPGTFVVNIGDLMAMWTNGRWTSTMHRVVNLARADADSERISIPFFHQPNRDALIECIPTCLAPGESPRFAPVTSGEWVRSKTRLQVGAA